MSGTGRIPGTGGKEGEINTYDGVVRRRAEDPCPVLEGG